MALISCKECYKQISDKAVACPNCGCPAETTKINIIRPPVSTTSYNIDSKASSDDLNTGKGCLIAIVAIVVMLIGVVLLTVGIPHIAIFGFPVSIIMIIFVIMQFLRKASAN